MNKYTNTQEEEETMTYISEPFTNAVRLGLADTYENFVGGMDAFVCGELRLELSCCSYDHKRDTMSLFGQVVEIDDEHQLSMEIKNWSELFHKYPNGKYPKIDATIDENPYVDSQYQGSAHFIKEMS